MHEKTATLLVLCSLAIFSSRLAAAGPVVLGEKYEAHASSELKSDKHAYAANKLVAPSLGTAWCEGAEGDGIGEWVELEFKEPLTVPTGFALDILPGYVASTATYKKNNRPKKMAVTLNDDTAAREISFEDYGKVQTFVFSSPGKPVKKIRLKLLEVYKGAQYADTCITDIAVRQPPKVDENAPDFAERAYKETEMLLTNVQPENIDRDGMSFIMGLSQGWYIEGAEGGETIHEDYMITLTHNPALFLWVLDKQSDAVLKKVIEATNSPILEYNKAELRNALKKGLQNLDIPSRERIRPLLKAYSIAD